MTHRRALDNARQKRRPPFKDRVKWDLLQTALVIHLNLDGLTITDAAEQCGAPVTVLERLIKGQSVTPKYFRKVAGWLNWETSRLYKKAGSAA